MPPVPPFSRFRVTVFRLVSLPLCTEKQDLPGQPSEGAHGEQERGLLVSSDDYQLVDFFRLKRPFGDVENFKKLKTDAGAVDVVFLAFRAVLQFVRIDVCFKGEKKYFQDFLFAGERAESRKYR